MSQTEYDVTIIGASFAGLTLAQHLSSDLRVLVIDAKPEPGSSVESTGLITERTRLEFAEFFDIDKYLTNSMNAICVVAPGFEDYFVSKIDHPWIYQTDTRALVKGLADAVPDNVTVQMKTALSGILYNDDGTATVSVRSNGNETEEIVSRFVVGADGSNSKLATLVPELDETKKFLFGYEQVYYGTVNLSDDPEGTIYHYWFGEFSLGYGGWLSPTIVNGRPAFRIGLAKLFGEHGEASELTTKFTEEIAKHGHITIESKVEGPGNVFGSFIPIQGPLKNISHQNALLIGDAAGFCGAFAADGIKGAVISGKGAAKLIEKYLSGDRFDVGNALKKMVNDSGGMMRYYARQIRYRQIWNLMKSDRTFKAMFDIIQGEKEVFLDKFCDNKDKHKSLAWTVLRFKNFNKVVRYSWYIILDLFK